jgi:hypothetical protein
MLSSSVFWGGNAMTSSGSEGLRTTSEKKTSLRPLTASERNQLEDLDWAATAPEVQQHSGKIVVIHNKRVIAVGTDRRSLLASAAAQEQCPWWELAVEIVPPEEPWEIPH